VDRVGDSEALATTDATDMSLTWNQSESEKPQSKMSEWTSTLLLLTAEI